MFPSKVKMAAMFPLIAVAIGGTGVGVYHVHAQAAKAPEKEADTLTTLMQQRLNLAQQEVEFSSKMFQAARVDFGAVVTASKDLLKAELELSKTRADRLTVHERYVKLMEQWIEVSRVRRDVGRGSGVDLVRAQYLLVDAKIDLEREKTRR